MLEQYIGIETVDSLAAKYTQDHPRTPSVFETTLGSLEARSQQLTAPQLPYEANKLIVDMLAAATEGTPVITNLYALLTQRTCATVELALARAALETQGLPHSTVGARTTLISLCTPIVRSALNCQGTLSYIEAVGSYAWSRQTQKAKHEGAPYTLIEAYACIAEELPGVCAALAAALKHDAATPVPLPKQEHKLRAPLSLEQYEQRQREQDAEFARRMKERGFN